MRSLCFDGGLHRAGSCGFFRQGRSGIDGFVVVEDADGEMGGEPGGAEKEPDAEHKFRTDGGGALRGRRDGGDVDRRADQREHRGESHRDDERSGKDRGEDHFHGANALAAERKRDLKLSMLPEKAIAQPTPNENGERRQAREFN